MSVLWVARKETVSEAVPQAERAEVCQSGVICGALLAAFGKWTTNSTIKMLGDSEPIIQVNVESIFID